MSQYTHWFNKYDIQLQDFIPSLPFVIAFLTRGHKDAYVQCSEISVVVLSENCLSILGAYALSCQAHQVYFPLVIVLTHILAVVFTRSCFVIHTHTHWDPVFTLLFSCSIYQNQLPFIVALIHTPTFSLEVSCCYGITDNSAARITLSPVLVATPESELLVWVSRWDLD